MTCRSLYEKQGKIVIVSGFRVKFMHIAEHVMLSLITHPSVQTHGHAGKITASES